MKKISLLGLCLLAIGSASAQTNLVKEVERTIKGDNVDYEAVRAQIAPALTHDETKNDAQTWFVAGKLEFDCYDNLFAKNDAGGSGRLRRT